MDAIGNTRATPLVPEGSADTATDLRRLAIYARMACDCYQELLERQAGGRVDSVIVRELRAVLAKVDPRGEEDAA